MPLNLHRILYFTCLLTTVFLVHAQKNQYENTDFNGAIEQPQRIEFPLQSQSENFYLINGGVEGILIIKERPTNTYRNKEWLIEALDTTLTSLWTRIYNTPFNFNYSGYEYSKNRYAILFEPGITAGNTFVNWCFDIPTGDSTTNVIHTTFNIELSEFETVGNTIILAGKNSNKTVVLTYDITTKKTKIQPGYYDPSLEILKISPVDEDSSYLLINKRDLAEKRRITSYHLIDQYGNKLNDYELPVDLEKSYTFGVPTHPHLNTGLLIGMFTRGKSHLDQGFYTVDFRNTDEEIRHYDFSDLDNFFSYLSPKQEQKIKNKSAEHARHGKKLRRSYKVNFSDIIDMDSTYSYVAEIYKAQYNNVYQYNPYDFYNSQRFFYNRQNLASPTIKTGYEYSHAAIINFDRNGQIKWDGAIKFDNLETSNLKKHLQSVPNEDGSISSLHMNKGNIFMHTISPDTIIFEKQPIKLFDVFSEIKSVDEMNELTLDKWYGRNFYLMGIQDIKKVMGKERRHETVFFINKITIADSSVVKQNQ